LAATTIEEALYDPETSVREAAAKVASALRDRTLRPHAKLLLELIRSPIFDVALAQLTIMLSERPIPSRTFSPLPSTASSSGSGASRARCPPRPPVTHGSSASSCSAGMRRRTIL
jgi:hypothetical protein